MKRLILAVLVVCAVSPAWGGEVFQLGNGLHKICQSKSVYNSGYCDGYMSGVADALQGANKGVGGNTFCHPKGVTVGQLSDVAKLWLSQNPKYRHFTGHSVVARALSEAFPCK
jgi:hypothetical protein